MSTIDSALSLVFWLDQWKLYSLVLECRSWKGPRFESILMSLEIVWLVLSLKKSAHSWTESVILLCGLREQKQIFQIHLKSQTVPIHVLLVNKESEGTSPVAVAVPPPKRFLTVSTFFSLFFFRKTEAVEIISPPQFVPSSAKIGCYWPFLKAELPILLAMVLWFGYKHEELLQN